jgi:putative copper resistance protein D
MGLSVAARTGSNSPWIRFAMVIYRVALFALLTSGAGLAQPAAPLHPDALHAGSHDGHHRAEAADAWEGSETGIAYSERNHHIAGFMVVLMGLAELSHLLRMAALGWARLLFPSALILAGLFLMIWSDHEAWPIGSLSFTETFAGGDHEILQHKVYGILALGVGSVELLRRLGRIGKKVWSSPLPLMAIVGGFMLFGHSHGGHPSAEKIAMHHAIMGTMAVTAGSSKLLSAWVDPPERSVPTNWEWVWVSLILLIGAQLLIYSE